MTAKVYFILTLVISLSWGTPAFCADKPAAGSPTQKPGVSVTAEPAATEEAPKEEIREKTLDGEIAGVSPNFIAIDYGQDEKTAYEMTFNITKDTRLERVKDIKMLKPGDTVWANYTEKVLKTGSQTRVLERTLKVLRLLKSAKIEPAPAAPQEQAEPEETAAQDNLAQEGQE